MVKILTYVDRKFDKRNGFSRSLSDEKNEKDAKRIYAEDELDEFLNNGWTIVSASTSEFVTGVLGNTTSFSKLVVILKK